MAFTYQLGKVRRQCRVTIEKTSRGKWYWKVAGGNHRVMAVGTDRLKSIGDAKVHFGFMCESNHPLKWKVYLDKSGKWRWTMSKKRDTVAAPYESFATKSSATRAARRVMMVLWNWGHYSKGD